MLQRDFNRVNACAVAQREQPPAESLTNRMVAMTEDRAGWRLAHTIAFARQLHDDLRLTPLSHPFSEIVTRSEDDFCAPSITSSERTASSGGTGGAVPSRSARSSRR